MRQPTPSIALFFRKMKIFSAGAVGSESNNHDWRIVVLMLVKAIFSLGVLALIGCGAAKAGEPIGKPREPLFGMREIVNSEGPAQPRQKRRKSSAAKNRSGSISARSKAPRRTRTETVDNNETITIHRTSPGAIHTTPPRSYKEGGINDTTHKRRGRPVPRGRS